MRAPKKRNPADWIDGARGTVRLGKPSSDNRYYAETIDASGGERHASKP